MNTKLNIVTLIAIIAFVLPAFAFAGTIVVEGTIKGANAVMNNQAGPANSSDPLVAIERDFVLTTTGAHHFLTNVPRSVKVGLIGKHIKVIGKKRAKGIFVDRIESKDGSLLYSWDAEHYSGDSAHTVVGKGRYPRGWDPEVGYY